MTITLCPQTVERLFDFIMFAIILFLAKTQAPNMLKEYFSIMTPLQYFLVISGVIITMVALTIAKRERYNALHFLVFLAGGIGLLVFGFFPYVLDNVAKFVGVGKGADALVYVSVVFLFYFSLLLLAKIESQREELTRLVRELALHDTHAKK